MAIKKKTTLDLSDLKGPFWGGKKCVVKWCEYYSGVRYTIVSRSVDLTESTTRAKVWLQKKTMDLCGCKSEECEYGVRADVNPIIMSDVLY